ncbi:MAG: PQQ-dependent sugar dehydrogenase [Anaerolineae bacterium]|nr:PQQ-dependent sugar dehydrogenase [Anaerolineae bacterium]
MQVADDSVEKPCPMPPTIHRRAAGGNIPRRTRSAWLVALWLGVMLALGALPAAAQEATDPPCRAGVRGLFRPPGLCAEDLLTGFEGQGIASVGGLAFGPDGALYFASPARRAVMRMMPDRAGRYDAPEVFAGGLPEPPIGLSYDAESGAWYASGDTHIWRLRDGDAPETLVDDLPGGAGGWLGNVRVGPDRRLYVAKGARCAACVDDDPRRAALLSFALDGGDMRIEATGLRDAFDFAWNPVDGALILVENERPGLPAELNMLSAGRSGPLDFGWPYCDADGAPVPGVPGADEARCAQTVRPVLTFEPESKPMGIVFYDGAAFPQYQGAFLVALGGSWNATSIAGYELRLVRVGPDGAVSSERVLPFSERSTSDASIIRTSFYPYHLTGLAVDEHGWLAAGVAEGRIYRFRPAP